MNGIQAVIFDLDGVIFDSQPVHFRVDMAVLAKAGAAVTQETLAAYAGTPNAERWPLLKNVYALEPGVDELIAEHSKILYEIIDNEVLPVCAGIPGFLQEIKDAGQKTAVASSSSRRFVETTLKKAGLIGYFDVIICGDEVKNGKPAPDIFLTAAAALNVPPDNCAVIEDSMNGVAAAVAAGIKCIGYRNKTSGDQDLSRADVIIDDFNRAGELIRSL